MRCAVIGVALSLLSLGTAAVARAQNAFDFVDADRETIAQMTRIVESVRAANLPTEPLLAKAGAAARVRVPPARLIAVLQAVAARLQEARDALGASSPNADIMAGADALSTKGVTKDMLQRIRVAQPSHSVAVPIGVMAQLVASGVTPKDAADIVSRLVRAKASNQQLVSLGNQVSQDILAGAGAGSALQIRLETLKPLLAYGASAGAAAQPGDLLTSAPGASSAGPKSPQNPRGRP
jgi:hypothetical protein